ncbi:DUF1516 family protein [Macrococcus hajekii]|uniref:UPF0344 protein ERX37_05045 n=1 Tax=Macrococcus hajekii TaxID=198482 RepID=A0A4R6BNQ7_9STAP|nr:YisL family protein [Macrococcus hajekii]TDM03451.1 DUF1516 family protein [Macrococcus hajekii]GGA99000.1 UPF0344 protein [Macrococcus hajekii]
MLHLHILSWILAIILFFAAYENFSDRQGPSRYFKPLHMVLRLFILLTLISGAVIFFQTMGGDMAAQYGIKFLLGLITVGLMEMTLARKKKKKPSRNFFFLVILFTILTIGMGIYLPMGPITALFN